MLTKSFVLEVIDESLAVSFLPQMLESFSK